ncbi:MAG: ferritin family protein [Clostridia bacterium]
MQLSKSKTYENLAKSFVGECQARCRYQMMEYGARTQGFVAMADLIKKVQTNEYNHARMFYTNIQKSGTKTIENIEISAGYPFKERWNLLDNLKFAVEDETNESTLIYPSFAKTADEEGFPEIAKLYRDIIQVETCHKKLFQQFYDQMKNGTMYKSDKAVKWKCGDCGYEATSKEAWEICPLCAAKQGFVLLQIQE